MSASFKVGDRVKLTHASYHPAYRAGDTGTVSGVLPATAPGDPTLYQVHMDGNKSAVPPVFYADDLEPAD